MKTLDSKIAVVTGSAQGIGKAIAIKLAQSGADIVVTDRNIDDAKRTAEEIHAIGRKAIAVQCDVTNSSEVEQLVAATESTFGRIDILVNNAGITRDTLLMRMSEQDWDAVLAVNLKGAFLVTKAVLRVMMQQRSGKIVNIASVVGLMGNAGQANYAASKGGLVAFTLSVAKELASRNITCNAVAPGFIETAMTGRLTEKVKDEYRKAIPLSRFGTADDVANAVLFLASDEACYITGQVISVDGGLAMR